MRFHRFAVFLLPLLLAAQSLQEFEKKVTEFTLPNGLHFIVVERHEAPVVSFHTYVNAGSVDDPSGTTGIAHMFEHMAFKGTESIGSKDWPAEKQAIDAEEAVYDRLDAERNKGVKADPQKVAALEAELKAAGEKANSLVEPNLYPRIIEQNGGENMNAQTAWDDTEYFYSLPSNRLELWFLLESQRFIQPVFREFYKERDVVMEEYRMRVESEPQGKLMQAFLATAFAAFPYRVMGAGWPSDVSHLRRADAWRFFHEYYVPGNITMGIVGDVDPGEARRLAEKYFGPFETRPLPPLLHTQEPPQEGPKQVEVESPSQPLLFVGYKRPDQYSKDDPVFDVIGRTHRPALQGIGARQADRAGSGGGRHLSRRQVSEPVPVLPGARRRTYYCRQRKGALRRVGQVQVSEGRCGDSRARENENQGQPDSTVG